MKNGVLAAPIVVLTSIRSSRPSGSEERIADPAPSLFRGCPSYFFQKVRPLKFFEFLFFYLQNKFFACSSQRSVAEVTFHGIERLNHTLKLPRPIGLNSQFRSVHECAGIVGNCEHFRW